jgi:hypothetical protein
MTVVEMKQEIDRLKKFEASSRDGAELMGKALGDACDSEERLELRIKELRKWIATIEKQFPKTKMFTEQALSADDRAQLEGQGNGK